MWFSFHLNLGLYTFVYIYIYKETTLFHCKLHADLLPSLCTILKMSFLSKCIFQNLININDIKKFINQTIYFFTVENV